MPSDQKGEPPAAAQTNTSNAAEEQATTQEAAYKFAPLPTAPDDSYADGAASVSGTRNVIKLDLYRVVGYDQKEKKEVRMISHRLVLPLNGLAELLQLIQGYGQAVQKMAQADTNQSKSDGTS